MKPIRCSVCLSTSRSKIERALRRGRSCASVATSYGVARSSLERHRAMHMGNGEAAATTTGEPSATEPAPAEPAISKGHIALHDRCLRIGALVVAAGMPAAEGITASEILGHTAWPELLARAGFDPSSVPPVDAFDSEAISRTLGRMFDTVLPPEALAIVARVATPAKAASSPAPGGPGIRS